MNNEQALWVVYPKVDRFVGKSGEEIKVDLTVQNLSDSALYFSKAEIAPSWAKGKTGIKPLKMENYLAAGESVFLAGFNMQLPEVTGLYAMRFGLETWIYNNYTSDWKNLGVMWTPDWGYIEVTPQPIHTAFVSFSSREEDRPVVEQIIKMMGLWGFKAKRIGIDVFSEDPCKIPEDIRKQIDESDVFIGIVTPRDYNFQEKRLKAFEWFHLEAGMAFKSDKPMLFIIDERLKPEGLLGYPNFPKVFYAPTKLDVLEHRLTVTMPGFRELIAEKKQERFFKGLANAGLILGGIWLAGKIIGEKNARCND
ncbi:MAG: hypothetical protein ABH886_06505 [Candidatus Desantisbacteria bacterium]